MDLPEEMKYISGGVFNGSKNLEYVKLPLKLEFLDGYNGSPFDYCTSLKKVDLPSHISFFHPGAWRFVNDFSPFMDLSELSIGEWMPHFNNSISFNKNTQVLIMPFTMERCVGMSDFNGYYQLTTIVIPPSVKEIGKYNDPDELSWPWTSFYKAIWEYEPYKGYRPAFYGQQHLSDVVNLSEEPQNLLLPDNYSFERRELKYTGGHVTSFGERSGEYVFRTLHVPQGCKQAYLDAGWGEGDRFDAIEEDAEEIYARIKSEGASFIPTIPTGVLATSPASALSVSRQGSVIRITNVNDNTPVDVYSVDGSFLYHTVASNGHALIDVGKQHGILLVKVGGETVKVVY